MRLRIRHPIGAVAVIVPARDEEQHITACLHSIRTALHRLPAGVDAATVVVLDRCRDQTAARVRTALHGWPSASVLRVDAGHHPDDGVGALRDKGFREAMLRLAAHAAPTVWTLHTDADTTVAPDWALAHLRRAATGIAGVAGTAELDAPAAPTAAARLRYHQIVERGIDGTTHRHVYGANLGVRGDAYLTVGGFPHHGAGEEHQLWERLRAAGYSLAQPTDLSVRTSARHVGRARGGLADLLANLEP